MVNDLAMRDLVWLEKNCLALDWLQFVLFCLYPIDWSSIDFSASVAAAKANDHNNMSKRNHQHLARLGVYFEAACSQLDLKKTGSFNMEHQLTN